MIIKTILPGLTSLLCLLFVIKSLNSQNLYFPPLSGNNWESLSPESLGWCTDHLPELYNFLNAEESKAFLVLKDGKIVLEKYFDAFTMDSIWYWASAGKTLTAFLTGIAQQEGKLQLDDPTSKYLGKGWTNTGSEQENKITIRHQLTMTSGLDDGVPDNHCTKPECLIYKSDPGQRWAYHNAPYTLLRDVLENATGLNENIYIQNRLKNRTGMNGFWITSGYDNVFVSTARSMARFGLLILNHGVWDRDSLMTDQVYFNEMIHPSQTINNSYGYLWWLNGQKSFMLPGLQIAFPGSYSPEAPTDMFAGIGKNGQLLCIVPGKNLVVLRLGESNGSGFDEVSIVLCNQIWGLLKKVICESTSINNSESGEIGIYPSPSSNHLIISAETKGLRFTIFNTLGHEIERGILSNRLDISQLHPGQYFLQYGLKGRYHYKAFVRL